MTTYTYESLKQAGWTDDQIRQNYPQLMPVQAAPAQAPPVQAAIAPVTPAPVVISVPTTPGMHGVSNMGSDASDVELGSSFIKYEPCALKDGGQITVRCVGDYARFKRHWITSDDGTPRPYNCGFIEGGKARCIIEDVTAPLTGEGSYEFVIDETVQLQPGQKPRKKRKYIHEAANPSLFAELLGKGAVNSNSWNAGENFLFNVIDRDSLWCIHNKHTQLLCKTDKALGIGPTLFVSMFGQCQVHGNYDMFDMVLMKSGRGKDTKYTASCAASANAKIPLTPDELNYARYDLAKFIKPADEDYVLNNLSGKLMKCILFCEQQGIVTPRQTDIKNEILQKGLTDASGNPLKVQAPAIAAAPTTPAPAMAPAPGVVAPAQTVTPPPPPVQVASPPPAQVAATPPPPAQATPPPPAQTVTPPPPAQATPPPPAQTVTPPPPAQATPPPPAQTVTPPPPAQATPPPPAQVAPAAPAAPAQQVVDISGEPGIQCPSCQKINTPDAVSCVDCGGNLTY